MDECLSAVREIKASPKHLEGKLAKPVLNMVTQPVLSYPGRGSASDSYAEIQHQLLDVISLPKFSMVSLNVDTLVYHALRIRHD